MQCFDDCESFTRAIGENCETSLLARKLLNKLLKSDIKGEVVCCPLYIRAVVNFFLSQQTYFP
jgi:hypothetical protein